MFQPKYLKNQGRYEEAETGLVSYFKRSFKSAKNIFVAITFFKIHLKVYL